MLSLLAVFSFAAGSSATTLYTSRSAWEAAVPGFTTDGLESHGYQQITGGSLVFTDFDFVVPFNHQGVGTCWADPLDPENCRTVPGDPANLFLEGDVHDGDDQGTYNELVFHEAITAFGFEVLFKEDAEDGSPLLIDIAGITARVNGPDGYPRFVGVVSDTPFTTVHIHGSTLIYFVDNVSYQKAESVPEPGSAALLAFALGALAAGRRSTR